MIDVLFWLEIGICMFGLIASGVYAIYRIYDALRPKRELGWAKQLRKEIQALPETNHNPTPYDPYSW